MSGTHHDRSGSLSPDDVSKLRFVIDQAEALEPDIPNLKTLSKCTEPLVKLSNESVPLLAIARLAKTLEQGAKEDIFRETLREKAKAWFYIAAAFVTTVSAGITLAEKYWIHGAH